MSDAESGRQFVDTNVIVYAFDRTAGHKNKKAREILEALWPTGRGCLSIQVLQEFYVSVTRRIPEPLSAQEATRRVAHYAEWVVHEPGRRDLLAAIDFHQRFQVSLWDALILQSASRLRCRVLWTEDLNDGQTYAGVTVRNPFLDLVME